MSFCLSVYFSSLIQLRKVRTKLFTAGINPFDSVYVCFWVCVHEYEWDGEFGQRSHPIMSSI